MDKNEYCCGENTHLVQVGDVLDRGPMELECLLLLCRRAREARASNGSVILLWGNHELYNAAGAFSYSPKTCNGLQDFLEPAVAAHHGKDSSWKRLYGSSTLPVRRAIFEPGGVLAKPFLSKLKVAVKVGRTVLVHAGLKHKDMIRWAGISGMNKVVREWILEDTVGKNVRLQSCGQVLCMPKNITDLCFGGGPWFARDVSHAPNKAIENETIEADVDAVLKLLDVDRMVVGHTVQQQIRSNFDGKVWCIDVGDGMSCVDPGLVRSEALEVSQTSSAANETVRVLGQRKRGDSPLVGEITSMYSRQ